MGFHIMRVIDSGSIKFGENYILGRYILEVIFSVGIKFWGYWNTIGALRFMRSPAIQRFYRKLWIRVDATRRYLRNGKYEALDMNLGCMKVLDKTLACGTYFNKSSAFLFYLSQTST